MKVLPVLLSSLENRNFGDYFLGLHYKFTLRPEQYFWMLAVTGSKQTDVVGFMISMRIIAPPIGPSIANELRLIDLT